MFHVMEENVLLTSTIVLVKIFNFPSKGKKGGREGRLSERCCLTHLLVATMPKLCSIKMIMKKFIL